ncbi:MAG TPA: radical SAM family heme chaperone HemW [Sphingobacteriaceae bacterium]
MAGIYLHVPFCKQACHYCDFHFVTSLRYKEDMLDAMKKELRLRKGFFGPEQIETIYFGGGTPSVLTAEEIKSILNEITELYPVANHAEITLEANPDDLNAQKVKALSGSPINRFSIGVQSFFDADLCWMNRPHNAVEAESSIKRAQDSGFENITIDLIYGFPLLTDEKWRSNIQKALELEVPHISSYSMTVEPRTALASFINKGKQVSMDDAQSAAQFIVLMDLLNKGGFEHYEISNFAKSGFYSKHNSNYWKGEKYIGIGPSAHSYNGETRSWNIANNNKYLEALNKGIIPETVEELSQLDKVNEYIMTSLRTIWGLDLGRIASEFGTDYRSMTEKSIQIFLEKDQLKRNDNIVTLTTSGKLFADHIASELFIIDRP